MPAAKRSHTFAFSFTAEPTVDELIAELKTAANVCGGAARVRVNAGENQRDGYYFGATVKGEA